MSFLRVKGLRIRGLRLQYHRKPLLYAPITTYTPRIAETAFSQINSNVDTSSADFKDNAAQMSELINSLRSLHAQIAMGGNEQARAKHLKRKKMLPRE
jgi:3-methylcrotonyl-CoA carboxylase beta subunit